MLPLDSHPSPCPNLLLPQMFLDVFKEDPEFKQHEEEYAAIKREILGEESGEEEESSESERERGSGEEEEESEEESEDEEETGAVRAGAVYVLAWVWMGQ